MTRTSRFLLLPLVSLSVLAAPARADEGGWVSLFDGKTLAGWKAASEGPSSFRVVDGTIACDGSRSHLFYVGPDGQAAFEDFELQLEVRTQPGANSGVYFHTAYQERDWPKQGFEVQVNNSQKQHGGYLEMKMTGSLYGIRNLYKAVARDDEWFTLNVRVRRPRVEVRVNDALVVDWIEPKPALPVTGPKLNRLGRGTFALQCHDPESRVAYRKLKVRSLEAAAAVATPVPVVDERYLQILELGRANFPLVDLHAHLKGGLGLEQALALSRETGIFLGVAANCGKGFPIQTDAEAAAFVDGLKGQPVFVGLQAEGREWVSMFSKETRARFDYVFTDGMTWTNPAGKRMRLWIPEEVEIGPDEQAFVDLLVSKIVGILETEPIDVYVNPTFLPAVIAERYDTLWTEARMAKVIDAAVRNQVAIEINGRYKIPSERFLGLAKSKGAKFTFGTNNTGAADLGDWSYPLAMQKALGLSWKDMFVPGRQPSRAQARRRTDSPLDHLPANVEVLTQFGERADFSPDSRRVAFMAKSFGDAFVIDLETRAIRCLTCNVPGAAFLRVMHLPSSDFLLIGPERFEDIGRSRSRDNELWFLSRKPGSRPVKLGRRMIEGAAISKRSTKIAFAVGHTQDRSIPEGQRQIVVAELDPSAEPPALRAERVVFTSEGPGCHPEAQDFYDDDRKLSYSCYEPESHASVWTIDLATGGRVNHSSAIGFYNEVEGIFPDGRSTCVESDHQSRPFGDPASFRNIDIWKLRLDGTGRDFARLTSFNDHEGWKASNPVVSTDGRLMAFQVARTADEAGVGYGIMLLRLDY